MAHCALLLESPAPPEPESSQAGTQRGLMGPGPQAVLSELCPGVIYHSSI